MILTRLRALGMVAVAPVVAALIAIVVTSAVVALSGDGIGPFWEVMLSAPSNRDWVAIINQTSMLFLSGVAAAIGFRMNLFNIGVEGQYTLAAWAAASFAGAALLPGTLNIWASLVLAMAVGSLWAGLPAVLKVTRGVSEVISTIMLNSIGIGLVGWMLNTRGERAGDGRRTAPIPDSSKLVGIQPFEARDGEIWALAVLAILVGVAMSLVVNRTRFGFDLRAAGSNQPAAVASGVRVNRMIVIAMMLSGAVAGLIWMPALFGGADYYGSTFQPLIGFTGIAVALLGRNRPLGIAIGAALFAWLSVQANPLEAQAGISPSIVNVTQGVVVLSVVIAYEAARRWRAAAERRALAAALARPAEVVA